MLKRKGFTLVELMVVILIVAILAAVAIPIMRGRIDAAKWSEGKAMMGTIATSIRTYVAAENTALAAADKAALSYLELGLIENDFTGSYFTAALFDWSVTYNDTTNVLSFQITATAPSEISSPTEVTLTQAGVWGETP